MKKIFKIDVFFKVVLMILALMPFSYSYSASDTSRIETIEKLRQSAGVDANTVLYIDFWASWCTPCRKSFPWMNSVQQKYINKPFKVIAVNVDKDRSLAEAFLQKMPANFSVYYDPKGEVAKSLKIKGMPSSFIVDHNGTLRYTHTGFFEHKTSLYEKQINELVVNAIKK